MKLKIITIDNKQYILYEDEKYISIYNSNGSINTQGDIISKAMQIISDEKIKNTKSEKYLVYDDDKYHNGFEYRIMYLKYVDGKYYEDNGRDIGLNISIEFKADEEVENRLKERENKIFEYQQKIEETNDSFYDFIDRKRKDYEQNKGDII